ncbi:MAG: GAF domain-containing protein [Anaerolineae bacterium]|nr:GAF domain-containing protein [Anaerolineae bacterium]
MKDGSLPPKLHVLAPITRLLSPPLSPEETLPEVLALTVQALSFSGGQLVLRDAQTGRVLFAHHYGLPSPAWGFSADQETSFAHVAEIDGKGAARHLFDAGLRSYTSVPIAGGQQVTGGLYLFDRQPHPLGEVERALLVAVAQQIGLAMEHARLLGSALREREVASVLCEAARAMCATLQLDTLLERVLDALRQLIPYEAAAIAFLPDPNLPRSARNGERVLAWIAAARGSYPDSALGRPFAPDEFPVIQHILQQREPVIVSAVQTLRLPLKGLHQAGSWLGLPLVLRGRVVGLLMAEAPSSLAYTDEMVSPVRALADQAAMALENARLYGQMQSQLREAMLLHSMTAAISSSLSIEAILPYVARCLCEILCSSAASIYTLDKEPHILNLVARYGVENGAPSLPVSLPAVDTVLVQRRPLQLRATDPGITAEEQAMLEAYAARSALFLPLVAHSRLIGLAAVWDGDPRTFTEGEIAIGQTLTHQAAVAMEHARLFTETEKAARQITALYETSRALSTSLETEALLRSILEAVHRALECEYVVIATVDDEAQTIGVRHGIWHGVFDAYPEWIGRACYPLSGPNILADICRTGRTEVISGWDDRFDREMWEHFHLDDFIHIFMPIMMRERVIGVVEVGYDKGRKSRVSRDEIQMLAAFMDQAAAALENARLFEEVGRRARELELLHTVSLAAATETRLEDTLQSAVETLAAGLGHVRVGLFLSSPHSHTLRLEAGVGYHPNLIGNLYLRPGEGIVGQTAERGEAILIPDVRTPASILAAPDTRSVLCVPLTAGPFIVGVLAVESERPNAFSTADVRLLSTLAGNLGMIVERARLFTEVEGTRLELQQRAQALETANKRLQELDRLKDNLVAGISHEFRTPLNSIIGFSEVLLKGIVGELTPKQRECVQSILTSGEHLLGLINQILDFYKLDAGRMTIEPAPFEVAKLLEEVRSTVLPLVEQKGQSLELDYPAELPPLVADRFRIKQVLLNLLSNAIKFTPTGGRIMLSCAPVTSEAILISVSDTGIGIRPEDREKIFEEFYQVCDSSAVRTKGTGLGLTISKRLIEMHHGRIWVESEYGKGATFSFILPLNTGAIAPRASSQ